VTVDTVSGGPEMVRDRSQFQIPPELGRFRPTLRKDMRLDTREPRRRRTT